MRGIAAFYVLLTHLLYIKQEQIVPRSEMAVMTTTVLMTLLSHNLALGVMLGIVMSTVFFSRKRTTRTNH
jgi:MFS superfamily sulfate permease-like transporter